MARPSTARVTTALRFPEDVHQGLREAADLRGMSMNDVVVLLVRYGLPRLRPFTLDDLFTTEPQP
jgi:hypothetical protein